MYNNQEDSPSFFKHFQKNNTLEVFKQSIEKIIRNWLVSDDQFQTKLESLQHISKLGINVDTLNVNIALPEFIKNFWNEPHQAVKTLDSHISKEEIRALIKETIKTIEQNPLDTSYLNIR